MAKSGSVSKTFNTGYKLVIEWEVNSQSVTNNTSNVTFVVKLVSLGASWNINSSASKDISLTVDGTKYTDTCTVPLAGNGSRTLMTKTVNIQHDSDGGKTFSMSSTLGIEVTISGNFVSSVTASGSGTLNTIPRASTFTSNKTTVLLGSTVTLNITRASSSFKHKVWFRFGTIDYSTVSDVGTSATITIPKEIANHIPNSTTGSGTLRVETFNGTTSLGTKTLALTVTVPDTAEFNPTLPTLTATRIDNTVPTAWGVYVQNRSSVQIDIVGAAGAYGSTIVTRSITGGGFSSNTTRLTTGLLSTSGQNTFTATVTDTRGRTATRTVEINVVAYAPPTFSSAVVNRCLANGTLSEAGTNISVQAAFSFSSVSSLNSLTTLIEYKSTTSGTWIPAGTILNNAQRVIGNGTILLASAYDVRLTLTDGIGPVTFLTTVQSEAVTMDFLSGGRGVSIGKMAETSNLFDVSFPTRFRGDVSVDGSLSISGVLQTLTGTVVDYAGSTAPSGWLLCNGSLVTITQYQDLFNIIGHSFALLGDNLASTTFRLPDLRGRVSVMKDANQIDFNKIGRIGGSPTHQLTTAQIPSHRHDKVYMNAQGTIPTGREVTAFADAFSSGTVSGVRAVTDGGSLYTGNTGGGLAHPNLQPYLVLNKIIKT